MTLSDHPVAGLSSADEGAIRALLAKLAESWDRSDAAAYGTGFTGDADYITFDGTHLKGREAVVRSHADLFEFFNTVFGESRLLAESSSIRFLTPDVALVHATGAVLFPWQKEAAADRRSINTSVVVRGPDGSWLVAAFQNTRVKPQSVPTGFSRRLLAALFRLRGKKRAWGLGARGKGDGSDRFRTR